MKVLGKPIAEEILSDLEKTILAKKLSPQLAIILAGDNPASKTYINFKQQAASKIGITVNLYQFVESEQKEAENLIQKLNTDPKTDGIIIQLPLFSSWNTDYLIGLVDPKKDVDGFLENSSYSPATALGTWEMLKQFALLENFDSVEQFLLNKNIVVLGKGKTAGKPIRELLTKNGFESKLIDSKTEAPNQLIQKADLIISAAGKKHLINASNIKDGVYIIGVGVGKEIIDGAEKTFGDVDESQIVNITKLYCPTIGGIGPLTVACLLRNVVIAASDKN